MVKRVEKEGMGAQHQSIFMNRKGSREEDSWGRTGFREGPKGGDHRGIGADMCGGEGGLGFAREDSEMLSQCILREDKAIAGEGKRQRGTGG